MNHSCGDDGYGNADVSFLTALVVNKVDTMRMSSTPPSQFLVSDGKTASDIPDGAAVRHS